MVRSTVGPFQNSGEAAYATRHGDGSLPGHDGLHRLLREALTGCGVQIGDWDALVARSLGEQDAATVAAVAGWVVRANLAGLADSAGVVDGERALTRVRHRKTAFRPPPRA
jgi:hypothetical protein